MKITTAEPVVENGHLDASKAVPVPEAPQIHIVLPPLDPTRTYHFRSPRLKNPEDAAMFVKVVVEEKPDADLR